MFYYPHEDSFSTRTVPAHITYAHFRLLHASTNAPSVDIYLNGKPIAQNFRYSNFSNYFKFPSGTYNLKVFPAGKTDIAVIDTQLLLTPNSIFTVSIIGELKNISIYPILEPIEHANPEYNIIRFIHLSPTTPTIDVTFPDGTKIFKTVDYKEITGYVPIHPGNYTIQARLPKTDKVILVVPNINLLPNKILSIYLVGTYEEKPRLQVLIPLDGASYLRDEAAAKGF